MARFRLFRRGQNKAKNDGRRLLIDFDGNTPHHQQLPRDKSAFSRDSGDFHPNECILGMSKTATRYFDEDASENMEDWFFRKRIDTDNVTRQNITLASSPPRRVQDLNRGPSGCGSTLDGGRDIEELAALDTSVLALAPGNQITGLDPSSDDESASAVRPVVVETMQLSRRKPNSAHYRQEASKSEKDADGGAVGDAWGRHISALDAVFGANKAKKPLSNEILPDESKIVRVLSVESPNSQDNKFRMAWMRNKKFPPPVYKLEPQVESPVLSKSRSGLDSTSMASATTGTSDNYTTDSVSTASSSGSGYRGGVRDTSFARTGNIFGSDNDESEFDDEMLMGGCVGAGCNPVSPCRTVAGELSYFVREIMDREIVIKEDSFLTWLMTKEPDMNGTKKRRGIMPKSRRADFSEFS